MGKEGRNKQSWSVQVTGGIIPGVSRKGFINTYILSYSFCVCMPCMPIFIFIVFSVLICFIHDPSITLFSLTT